MAQEYNDTQMRRNMWWLVGGALAILLLLALVIPALNNNDILPGLPNTGGSNATTTVSIKDIRANPVMYVGKKVMITDVEVQRIESANSFVADQYGLTNDTLLVVGSSTANFNLKEDQKVIVVGTVESFVPATLEQNFQLGLSDALKSEFQNSVFINAETVSVTQEN